MLGVYLNQKAQYEAADGTNDRGVSVYDSPRDIMCRKQTKVKTAIAADKQVVYVETVYYTAFPVQAGDRLDGEIVKAVSIWSDLYGRACGYKAVM